MRVYIYEYAPPVVATRQVGYSTGSSAAQTQSFAYTTSWTAGGSTDFYWTAKTTTVTTTDDVLAMTAKTVYAYSGFNVPPQPGDFICTACEVPLESQIQYCDFGASTPLRTVNKTWYTQYELKSQQTVLETGASSQD